MENFIKKNCLSCQVISPFEKYNYGAKIFELTCKHTNKGNERKIYLSLKHITGTVILLSLSGIAMYFHINKLYRKEYNSPANFVMIFTYGYLSLIEIIALILAQINVKARFLAEMFINELTQIYKSNINIKQLLISTKMVSNVMSVLLYLIPILILIFSIFDVILTGEINNLNKITNSITCSIGTYTMLSLIFYCNIFATFYEKGISEMFYNLKENLNRRMDKRIINTEFNNYDLYNVLNTHPKKVVIILLNLDLAGKTFTNYISPIVCTAVSLLPVFLTVGIIHFYNVFLEQTSETYFFENIILLMTLLSFLIPFFIVIRRVHFLRSPVCKLE